MFKAFKFYIPISLLSLTILYESRIGISQMNGLNSIPKSLVQPQTPTIIID
jgi:hypothetical protein